LEERFSYPVKCTATGRWRQKVWPLWFQGMLVAVNGKFQHGVPPKIVFVRGNVKGENVTKILQRSQPWPLQKRPTMFSGL